MKEHPIMFSTEMVKAILEGRKTQTRRVIKYQAEHRLSHPYYKVGDVLWVKETFMYDNKEYVEEYKKNPWMGTPDQSNAEVYYKANEEHPEIFHWRSPMFMPHWASRIDLKIINIRAERLQDISEEDCAAEGVRWMNNGNCKDCFQWTVTGEGKDWYDYADDCYKNLWNKINGKKYPWNSNPWVWVIEFEVMG